MKIVSGKIYRVEIDDCCVGGRFTSKLLKAQSYDDSDNLQSTDEMDYDTVLIFENGVTIRSMGGVQLEEVVSE